MQGILDSDSVNKEVLLNNSWDVIKFKISIDAVKINKWFLYIEKHYKFLKFSFECKELLKDEYITDVDNDYGFDNVLKGKIYSYTLDWPVEKDIPIPPVFAANPTLFPELNRNFPFKIQDRYKFGYFKKICEVLGEDVFLYSRITIHETDAEIKKHVDNGIQGLRLHIPIVSNNESKFLFGEKLEREYTLMAGSVYVINGSIPHATINKGLGRVHIISDPGVDKILELLKVQLIV